MSVPIERLACEARRVCQAIDHVADEACAALGLAANERDLLDLLDRKSGPVEVADLARVALLPRTQLLDTLRRLQACGWVIVQSETEPAKARLNAAGRDLCATLRSREDALWQRLQDVCGEAELHATFATLRHVRRALRRAAAA